MSISEYLNYIREYESTDQPWHWKPYGLIVVSFIKWFLYVLMFVHVCGRLRIHILVNKKICLIYFGIFHNCFSVSRSLFSSSLSLSHLTLSLVHSLTLSLSHSLALSHSHSLSPTLSKRMGHPFSQLV